VAPPLRGAGRERGPHGRARSLSVWPGGPSPSAAPRDSCAVLLCSCRQEVLQMRDASPVLVYFERNRITFLRIINGSLYDECDCAR
jgi:hypothetical protein